MVKNQMYIDIRNTRGEKRKDRDRQRKKERVKKTIAPAKYTRHFSTQRSVRSLIRIKRTALVLWTEILVYELASWRTSSLLIIVIIKLVHNFLHISTRRCLVPDLRLMIDWLIDNTMTLMMCTAQEMQCGPMRALWFFWRYSSTLS
jgi:hypothetical protein